MGEEHKKHGKCKDRSLKPVQYSVVVNCLGIELPGEIVGELLQERTL